MAVKPPGKPAKALKHSMKLKQNRYMHFGGPQPQLEKTSIYPAS